MRGRAAQGPSNPASQGFGQAPRTGLRWGLQAEKSLFAERRLFLFPRPVLTSPTEARGIV